MVEPMYIESVVKMAIADLANDLSSLAESNTPEENYQLENNLYEAISPVVLRFFGQKVT